MLFIWVMHLLPIGLLKLPSKILLDEEALTRDIVAPQGYLPHFTVITALKVTKIYCVVASRLQNNNTHLIHYAYQSKGIQW